LIARLALSLLLSLAAGGAGAALSGKLVSTGSDTLGALSSLWAQALMRDHPAVTVQVRAVGSSAAPTALLEGTADIGPMSRPMTAVELQGFTERYGYAPTAVPVAVDTLAVFVHRENPLRSIRRSELDAIFSANRRCGGVEAIDHWSQLGLGGPWENRPVVRYGRGGASGTFGYFRTRLLCGGDYAARVNRLVGSAAVVRAVGDDPAGIGYGSAGFLSPSVRRLRVLDEGVAAPSLSRDLTLYVNLEPGRPLPALLRAYLRVALGQAGQNEVRAVGYTPLDRARRDELWDRLELERSP
jgi:phosphate transport system substrate-binding protein